MPPADYSRLADTAPALLGVVAILVVLVPVALTMVRRVADAVDRSAATMAKAVDNNTAMLERLRDRADSRESQHFDVLKQLGERCLADHQLAAERIGHVAERVEIVAAVAQRIEDRLGKDHGAA